MITECLKKPDCFDSDEFYKGTKPPVFIKGTFPVGHRYAGYPYGYLGVMLYHELAVLHLHIMWWTPTVLKELKRDWFQVLDILKAKGVKQVSAVNNSLGDGKWPRFIKYFGFGEPEVVATAYQEIG